MEQKFHIVHEKKIRVVKIFHLVHEKNVQGGKKLQNIRLASIIILHSLQMRVLLENTTFPLHKIVIIAGIIRVAGIIRGRALYEEIRYF